jgi:hypothetical protein
MRSLLNPKWLFVLNSLPTAVLLLLLGGEFSVIKSLLPPPSLQAWRLVPALLLALAALPAGVAVGCLLRRRPLPLWYAPAALLLNGSFMWYYFDQAGRLLFPWEVPRWVIGPETDLYAFTFLMPTMAHALLVLVARSVPEGRSVDAWPNFGLALGVPLLAGLAWHVLWLPLRSWHLVESVANGGFLVLGPLLFLFFLTRGLLILVSRRGPGWAEPQLLLKVLIAGVMPVAGLALNRSLGHIFGDFDSPWFYGLAVLNAGLLCLPLPAGRGGRLALLLGRCALLSYTLYFFLVFLPWLPLSVLAIILLGTGFLMLTPLLLLLVHLTQLGHDLDALRGQFSPAALRAAVAAGVLVLPLGLTLRYWHDRRTLHAALDYVYAPDYARRPRLDHAALARTLDVVEEHKSDLRGDWASHGQPYLSTYFNWLVLDNLTLSDDKLGHLRQIFRPDPEAGPEESREPAAVMPVGWQEGRRPDPTSPQLTALRHRSRYDARQAAWTSWVDLELTGPERPDGNPAEYATELTLPAGCWVQDYYLDIEGRREHGLLAEKKAAAWVYAQIRTVRRDPGIVHYLGGNRVGLRVYPFTSGQLRRTGLCLVHKEPVTLQIDGQPVTLGDATAPGPAAPVVAPGRAVVYLSAAAQQRLPRLQRRPYYHFLLDASEAADVAARPARYARLVAAQLARRPLAAAPRFTLVDAYAQPLPAGADWQQQLRAHEPAGGLYLAGAIRRTLAQDRQQPRGTYPVLVLVSDRPDRAVLDADFAELAAAYPESPAYYVLGPDGQLTARSLLRNAAQPWPAAPAPGAPASVRAWPTAARPRAFLPDNQQPAVVLDGPAIDFPATLDSSQRWTTGLLLEGYRQQLALHPAQAEATRLPAIRASFRSGLLTPLTAYLSLENDAQKAALRRKQEQTLSANAALDAGEDTPPSAVPIDGGVTLLLAAGGALGLRQLRRKKPTPARNAHG